MDIFAKSSNKKIENISSSPMEHCKSLIKEADEILSELSMPKKKSTSVCRYQNILPVKFINAVENLTNRIKSNQIFDIKRIPFTASKVSDKIGPGYYNIERSLSPGVTYTNRIFSSNCI